MWRCFFGTFSSAANQASIVTFHGPSKGHSRVVTLRAGGNAESSAVRTIRQSTPKFRDSPRIDGLSVPLLALRVSSNSSTFDLFAIGPRLQPTRAELVDPSIAGSQVGPDQMIKVGPTQVITPTQAYSLDEVRREVWNEARKAGPSIHAKELKGCRYALWRNPEDLTRRQEAKLAWIAKVKTRLYRAYLMKEQLRIAIRTRGVLALTMLDAWLLWAQRCRIGAFVELGRKIKMNIAGIEAAMLNNLSNECVSYCTSL